MVRPGLDERLVTTAIDATGMGLVVTEQLQMQRPRGELYPVLITGGVLFDSADGYFAGRGAGV